MSNSPVSEGANEGKQKRGSHRVAWSILFFVIAALSVVAVTSFNRNFHFSDFFKSVSTASAPWIAAAVCGTFGYILFEALSLMYICRSFGYGRRLKSGLLYSSTGFYFSSITPSATGGQPAQAYVMIKDGIPGVFAAVALLVNLLMYTLSIAVLGIFAFIARPSLFMKFSVVSRIMIIVGTVIQFTLAALVLILLKNKRILYGIGRRLIHFAAKLRLVKNEDKLQNTFGDKMSEYDKYAEYLHGKRPMMAKVLGINILQRASVISVTMFTFIALGGRGAEIFNIFVMQIYVLLGSTFVPIPGSIGVTDYLMIDGFSNLIVKSPVKPGTLELLSRTLSFYICVFVCGLVMLYIYFKGRKANDRNL